MTNWTGNDTVHRALPGRRAAGCALALVASAVIAQAAPELPDAPPDHTVHGALPEHAAHDAPATHPMASARADGAGARHSSASVLVGVDAVVVDFELLDRHGNIVRDEEYRGRYLLLAFGFTNCPHICPLMAFNMGAALEATEHDAAGVFVSVDTERDTPAITDAYASSFSDRMTGLGGSRDQINAAANNFRVSYAVTKTQSTYTVQHTATTYLIGPDGQLLETFAVNASAAEIVAAMR
jgi:protein SCO1/2